MVKGLSYAQRGRLGALRRYELYGNPGTLEGRSKGGRHACEFFRLHPEKARQRGFVTRKAIKKPKKSVDLAEFIGIMLGDGGFRSKYQFTVSLNYKDEKEYIEHVVGLVKRLFSVGQRGYRRKGSKGIDIVVSSKSAVDCLLEQGLMPGNKIKNQVDIPAWVKDNSQYRLACLRGLFDTDGSLYRHRYKVNKKYYRYLKLDFTSCSKPLLHSAHMILCDLGIKATINGVHLSISAQADVNKYCAKIGSSNLKFVDRWRSFWRGG